ncbi:class I SAM-dependent methyltransferase [Paracrocinitomix mangrovi]|uniref:class I SAM-dependent methyltransferase n=1 Tax=Paracrocinitomix mangrovi TaxID=2862509 RepID=UPI001C8D8CB1|nr:class I SAM-dependent methyltransferase [Paracrocinitomix mangrovi]UKN03311.1 class I SAM-dependent methyltransferase [Paracrocinitomix mangrovi]
MPSNLSKKELHDIIQWDVKTWSRALNFWEQNADLSAGKTVLAIGEREGGLSLWLAQKGLKVTCTDYNDFPSTTEKMHQDYGVSDLIEYHNKVDVTDLSRYPDNHFDFVVFKSVIGVLSEKDRQQKALDEIYRVLKDGGSLIFAENLKATKLHGWLRKKFIRWNHYWRYLHLKDDMDLFSKFQKRIYKTEGFLSNFGRSEKQRSLLAGFDKSVKWMTPKSWRYVLMGVLTK